MSASAPDGLIQLTATEWLKCLCSYIVWVNKGIWNEIKHIKKSLIASMQHFALTSSGTLRRIRKGGNLLYQRNSSCASKGCSTIAAVLAWAGTPNSSVMTCYVICNSSSSFIMKLHVWLPQWWSEWDRHSCDMCRTRPPLGVGIVSYSGM